MTLRYPSALCERKEVDYLAEQGVCRQGKDKWP